MMKTICFGRCLQLLASALLLVQSGHALAIPTSAVHLDHTLSSTLTARGEGRPRTVHWITDISQKEKGQSTRHADHPIYNAHSSIEFGPTSDDGPFRVEIVVEQLPDSPNPGDATWAARVRGLDMTKEAKNRKLHAGQFKTGDHNRMVWRLADTTKTNNELMHRETGLGLVLDAWTEDPEYRVGTVWDGRTYNGCHTLALRLVRRLYGKDARLPSGLNGVLQDAMEYAQYQSSRKITTKIDTFYHDYYPIKVGVDNKRNIRTIFDVSGYPATKPTVRVTNRPSLKPGGGTETGAMYTDELVSTPFRFGESKGDRGLILPWGPLSWMDAWEGIPRWREDPSPATSVFSDPDGDPDWDDVGSDSSKSAEWSDVGSESSKQSDWNDVDSQTSKQSEWSDLG